MKKSVKTLLVAAAGAFLLSSASSSFAQYDACAPACDVPAVEACAPTCDTSYAPTCETPTCDVPTCGPSYSSCLPAGGCYQGAGCGSVCGGLYAFVDDVARVAVAPFHWVAGAFTDGIYPDCGCAPIPPKTACNPCTICGDYVGGCNDGSCAPCAGGYAGGAQVSYGAEQFSYPSQSYGSSAYDVEAYDASPTRLSSTTNYNNGASFTQTLRGVFGTQRPVAPQGPAYANAQPNVRPNTIVNNVQPNSVRSVSYEQNPVPMQNIRQAQDVRTAPQVDAQRARMNRELQNKQNVRIVSAQPTTAAPATKTFGKTRPVK